MHGNSIKNDFSGRAQVTLDEDGRSLTEIVLSNAAISVRVIIRLPTKNVKKSNPDEEPTSTNSNDLSESSTEHVTNNF